MGYPDVRKEIALPEKKYSIIYADSPWSYRRGGKRNVERHYQTMTPEEICALPVEHIAAEDCALFLWATFPNLELAVKTIEQWGFTYKTAAFVWVKTNKRQETLFWGMGNYTRANAEVCLLGIKGNPKKISRSVHSVIMAKIGRHSEKPAEARKRIVELFGDVPRIELFARERVEGWDVWGNEVENGTV